MKAIRLRLTQNNGAFEASWGSIRLLQELLVAIGLGEETSIEIVEPFKQLHFLRSKVKGHAGETEKAALIKNARGEHGSLAAHYRDLVARVQTALARISEVL